MLNLKPLYQITSDSQLSFDQKMHALLQLGLQYFQLDIAIISEIKDDDYIVYHAISPDNSLLIGTIFPINDTYCVHTLANDEAVSFHHAGTSHIAQHPCYLNFGLESYIGAPILVEGKRFGTINFSSSQARAEPFNQDEHDFIELLSHWTGNEIARNEKLTLLQAQQKKMAQQQKSLEQMGQLAGVGAWEVDLINNKIYWSEVTRQIHEVDTDYLPEMESGINFYKAGENRERITSLVNKAIEQGGHFSGEFEIVTAKGKAKWVASKGLAELENGQCVRLIGAFQDITSQVYYREQLEKRHEELSLALESRSLFLANMSHEIRTPINGVLGMLQILEASSLNQEQQHFLTLAKDSANSLLGIISDILDFTKIDSGKLTLEKHPFNLNQLLNNCIDIFKPRAQDKSISLIKEFAATQNIIALADPTRLRQICSNLVSNALKFTHQGRVTVTSHIHLLQDDKAIITITVADTGIGIANEHLAHLFSPFSQADDSTTRKFGGTGLGLSIIKNLCQLMNGDVNVESTPNKGSTFEAMIEVELQTGEQANIADIELANDKTKLEHLRVLVVEDNEINQIVVGEMLKQQQIEFDVVGDGLQALAKLKQEAQNNRFYSLIFMDCQMPNMDGYQATEVIRKLPPPLATIPIIALTANAMSGEKEKCIASGMNDYLSKPIEQKLLNAILEKFA
ncbi:GAF domain-containing hybrid sensor histidine kinase/response regulator [Paraglaciecola hydrolytica]|uniref:histidine kinase n=1 Tax=Paraglaciecola hydrolytica TaxID=1799789 RepID=A0A135ZZB6_9ALTE|nr:ATP-binding protein [Paraglaciecola hydrolytica]KXI28322.1 hybrid sensor histidine kinase/response regulator [Paraglaciecola hydrolytica]